MGRMHVLDGKIEAFFLVDLLHLVEPSRAAIGDEQPAGGLAVRPLVAEYVGAQGDAAAAGAHDEGVRAGRRASAPGEKGLQAPARW